MSRVKTILLRPLTAPWLATAFRPLTAGRAVIFMLHRFEQPGCEYDGHDTEAVREGLAWLRRRGHPILSLEELLGRLAGEGPPPRGAIAFTLDDGYLDQARVAAPLFAEFDCPVTTFVTTGFLDGRLWMWWDRIEWVFRTTRVRSLRIPFGEGEWSGSCADAAARRAGQSDFTERCKRLPDAEKHAAIERLAAVAEVEIPREPPAAYAPMSWDDVRACERLGMRFGPHTVTHPILSMASDEQAPREIRESWERLCAEAAHPVRVFCYPNGQAGDYGPREFAVLEQLGFPAGLSGIAGYAACDAVQAPTADRFEIRRFNYPDRLELLAQIASGFERFKEIVRGAA